MSSNDSTLFVGLERECVSIRTDDHGVRARIAGTYRHMLTSSASSVVGDLEIYGKEERYSLWSAAEPRARDVPLPEVLRHLKQEIVVQLMDARPDLLWMHAGAAAVGGRSLLLVGAWGSGKSTLVTALCRDHGWTYLSDDIVPIDLETGNALPFPLVPVVREHSGRAVPRTHVSSLNKRAVVLDPSSIGRAAVSVDAIVLPRFTPGAEPEPRRAAPGRAVMTMVENCLSSTVHRGEAVRYLCDAVERLPVYDLPYQAGEPAARALVDLLHTRPSAAVRASDSSYTDVTIPAGTGHVT